MEGQLHVIITQPRISAYPTSPKTEVHKSNQSLLIDISDNKRLT